jgi:hypothetical protein
MRIRRLNMAEVALLHAEAGSAPSGTGSFSYFTNFRALVENVAFSKIVGIWGHNLGSGTWGFFPCNFSKSVPNNKEVWVARVDETEIDQFDVEYQVSGGIVFDNNAGFNYVLDTGAAHSDGIGTAVIGPNVLAVSWDIDSGGTLSVDALVKNLAFVKQVAMVYTLDNWVTFHNAFGTHSQDFPPPTMPHQVNSELWTISVALAPGSSGRFAVFYMVDGATYWDNNVGVNYSFA